MGQVTNRNGLTSRGFIALSSWSDSNYIYTLAQINLGSNPNSKLEVVSALNSFNLAANLFHYNQAVSSSHYNPKLYIGTVQTTALNYLYDVQNAAKYGPGNADKSGSCSIKKLPIH